MANISIQELRNHSRDVIGRADRGERITITRYGRPVAELRPALRATASAERLLARHRLLLEVDAAALRADADKVISSQL